MDIKILEVHIEGSKRTNLAYLRYYYKMQTMAMVDIVVPN